MRILRFLGRWYLIGTVAAWVVLGGDPRETGLVLLGVVVFNNWRRRRDRAQAMDRPVYGPPPPYPYHPPPPAPPAPPPAPPGGWLPPAGMVAWVLVAVLAIGGLGSFFRPARAEAAVAHPGPVAAPSIGVPDPTNWLFEQLFIRPLEQKGRGTLLLTLGAAEASFLTPPVNQEPRVDELFRLLLIVGDSLLLLLVVVGAIMVVAGDWTYLQAKELAPRVLVSGVVMNLSLVVLGEAITISNSVVRGFLDVAKGSLTTTANQITQQITAPVFLALLLVVVLFLLVANLLRLVIVVVLAVGGPILHALGVIPATEGFAKGWWHALAACLVAPVVQALLLVVGVWIAFTSDGPFAAFSGHPWSNLIDQAVLIAIVAMMAVSPVWMLKKALGGSARQVTRALVAGRRMVTGGVQ